MSLSVVICSHNPCENYLKSNARRAALSYHLRLSDFTWARVPEIWRSR